MGSGVAVSRPETVLAGGVSSPVRAGVAVGGEPFVQSHGRGAYAFDAAGRAYVDYLLAYGPLFFGHAHPQLISGLDAVAARGTVFGSTHDNELRLADRIARLVPSMQRLRFTTTGTEAMMSAIRVARAFTGRSLILRFAGNYHGHFDAALHSAGASADTGDAAKSGIPPSVLRDVAVARYNDLADVDAKLGGRTHELAAIVVEPIVGNMGLVLAEPGFLDGLFVRAREAGALVVFDEIITWPRAGLGGAQAALGYEPDLTALGKVLGGGMPLAAFGGRVDVMAALAPEGAAFTGGTFAGNPFGVTLAHRVLDMFEAEPDLPERVAGAARDLAAQMRRVLAAHELEFAVTVCAGMLDLKFAPTPPRDYDTAARADRAAFAAFYHAMRERGVLLPPSPNELLFLSTAHGPREFELTLSAFDASLRALRESGTFREARRNGAP
jgi:glutamate-1-semialdehyde 2,1-aminomutase